MRARVLGAMVGCLASTAAAGKLATTTTVARTSGLSLTVPARWEYSADHVGSEDTWEVVTAGLPGSSASRGSWISLSSTRRDYETPSEAKTVELLRRLGRPIASKGDEPDAAHDHVDTVAWGKDRWIVREIDGREHQFYGYAYRRSMTYFVFARVEPAHLDEMRKVLASIRIR